jgi:hypothetical protein
MPQTPSTQIFPPVQAGPPTPHSHIWVVVLQVSVVTVQSGSMVQHTTPTGKHTW